MTVNGLLNVSVVQHYPDRSAQARTSGAYSKIVNNGRIVIDDGATDALQASSAETSRLRSLAYSSGSIPRGNGLTDAFLSDKTPHERRGCETTAFPTIKSVW